MGWSLKSLLDLGIPAIGARQASGPAKHLQSAIEQLVDFFGIMQNEAAGAQAISSFDTLLAPFVKIDNLSEKEVIQCMQMFLFGINAPTRWGSQQVFSNITIDWNCPDDLKNKKVTIANKEMDFTYGDCQPEIDLLNKCLFKVYSDGDYNNRGFPYPIPTVSITKDFPWEHPNCELLFGMAAKYGIPYFSNYVSSDMNPDDVRSMCCRLRLDLRELRNKMGGLFGSGDNTGSVSVTTLNMPRLGYLAGKEGLFSVDVFWEKLDNLLELAFQASEIRRKEISKLMEKGLYPYTSYYLGTLDNHFSTIGLVGMHEMLLNLFGRSSGIQTKEGHEFAVKVLQHIKEKCSDFQVKSGNLYNLEATPAESVCYRLAKHDVTKFPSIITSGKPGNSPYYTNSSNLPVGFTFDIFKALENQEQLQIQYTGGVVFHIFLSQSLTSWQIARDLIKKTTSISKLPYFTISPTYSICEHHGFLIGEHKVCPLCIEEQVAQYETKLKEYEAMLEEKKKE
jgi:ribonucleoside-triphosphate reductase